MSNLWQQLTYPAGIRRSSTPTLRRRLVTLLGSMLLVTLVVVGVGVFLYISRNERQAWEGRQRQAALAAGDSVAAFLQRAENALGLIGALERDYLAAKPQALADLIQRNPALLEVARLDEDGLAIANAYQDAPVLANQFTIPQSNWFVRAKAGEHILAACRSRPTRGHTSSWPCPPPMGASWRRAWTWLDCGRWCRHPVRRVRPGLCRQSARTDDRPSRARAGPGQTSLAGSPRWWR